MMNPEGSNAYSWLYLAENATPAGVVYLKSMVFPETYDLSEVEIKYFY
jgi:hypothetical protein